MGWTGSQTLKHRRERHYPERTRKTKKDNTNTVTRKKTNKKQTKSKEKSKENTLDKRSKKTKKKKRTKVLVYTTLD